MFGVRDLRLSRERTDKQTLFLDEDPSGREEEFYLFSQAVDDPRDINDVILRERMQDMSERIIFADRAFFVTMIWVWFLVALTLLQVIVSFWERGLSDAQYVTVVTTTTASGFGFWLLVGKYLHRNQNSSGHIRLKDAAGSQADTESREDT
jgi:hypothetical protein